MRISLIIAAGGSGSRFQAGYRRKHLKSKTLAPATKLFVPLAGIPLLFRTLAQFHGIPEITEIVLALPTGLKSSVMRWAKSAGLKPPLCVLGGKTRSESVQRALRRASKNQSWIMIHDGARPLIDSASVRDLIHRASRNQSAQALVLAKKVIPTIKKVPPGRLTVDETLNRDVLYEAETPQLFRRGFLERAYRTVRITKSWTPTDEASLVEKAGGQVELVPHEGLNPKITTIADFELAEAYLKRGGLMDCRIGLGSDSHRLIAGRPFWLGGVLLKSDYGPLGHSDGDALIHAVIDALLGALALGDIGDFFSEGNARYKNIASGMLLKTVMDLVKKKGWRPAQVDTVIHLERPRLGLIKHSIKKKLCEMLELEGQDVSIKAKTFEGDGTGGAGLLIQCDAVAVMRRL